MKDKVVLITGGTRGIGLGIAEKLAAEGITLALNGIREIEEIEPVLKKLSDAGAKVIYVQGNISREPERQQILEKVRNNFGRLDVLVNNAGRAPRERRDLLEMSEESYEEVMRSNLQGPFFLTQSVAHWMIGQKKSDPGFQGMIINISSVSATLASTNRGEYCISKAGISMMSSLFAVRLSEFDIAVYEIRPGVIKTDMTSAVTEKYDRLIQEGLTLQKRWGTPGDVGKAVAALVRNDLPYSTGQVIMIDGGMNVGRL